MIYNAKVNKWERRTVNKRISKGQTYCHILSDSAGDRVSEEDVRPNVPSGSHVVLSCLLPSDGNDASDHRYDCGTLQVSFQHDGEP